jgi:hypothetical protein
LADNLDTLTNKYTDGIILVILCIKYA